ncbi:MAG: YkvA family protein [Anaerotignum propionicum]|uniref:YkvA family protein n=1 Tax=Anaerotignum propionicum TaxID=28446 RepID=UPI002B20A2B5|nr:YkvA family protein [Anaerotignum propionicum]MEA5057699.1 YkvA family protein [Anaerotignum propionicum]
MNLKDRARQLKIDIPTLFIALKDKETPFTAKILAGIVVVYALSPVDLIPDFIPVLGYLDDLIILPALIAMTVKLIPSDIMKRCREEAEGSLKAKKNWLYAIPFVLVWIVILLFILHAIFS